MATKLNGRHFVSVADFSGEEILQVLKLAEILKLERYSGRAHPLLQGMTLGMIFQKPSLRTRVSFEAGMTQLGGHAIYLAPTDIKIGEREITEDIAKVLSSMVDIIMARTFGHDIVVDLAKYSRVPVINGLSDTEHPCQILADLQTIMERKNRLEGLKFVYVGDGNNVAHSLMLGGARVGMHVKIATPPGFEPKPEIVERAAKIGAATGSRIEVSNHLEESVEGADVLYTDVWASMGQEAEAKARQKAFQGYTVNRKMVERTDSNSVLLHCLPAHYGDEIDYEASRMPNSAIFEQAENRLHAQKALLVMLAGRM